MKLNLFILLIFLQLNFIFAYAEANQCSKIFSANIEKEAAVFPRSSLAFDSKKLPKGDGYSTAEHRENFWNIHDKFGFFSENGRTFLLAKTMLTAEAVTNELARAKTIMEGLLSEVPPAVNPNAFSEVGGGRGFISDVTSLIPKTFNALNEFYSPNSGPNCWNFSLYFNRIAFSLHETSPIEFKFWIESPLARKLNDNESLKPGDVIVFRLGDDEVHTAVFLTPRVVLSKNGTEVTRPYRIMEINEMAAQYLNVHPVFGTRLSDHWFVVRLSSLEKYYGENKSKFGLVVQNAYADLLILEEKLRSIVFRNEASNASSLVKSYQNKHQTDLVAELAKWNSNPASPSYAENKFFITGLILRIESLLLN